MIYVEAFLVILGIVIIKHLQSITRLSFHEMKKSSRTELDRGALDRILALAQEEKKPFEEIKKHFGLSEKEVTEIMKQRLSPHNFEMWKKKTAAKKPKPMNFSAIEDDDLDTKYYIRNKF